jgi:hypothetical protein
MAQIVVIHAKPGGFPHIEIVDLRCRTDRNLTGQNILPCRSHKL